MLLYWQSIQIQKIHNHPEWVIGQEIQEYELSLDMENIAW